MCPPLMWLPHTDANLVDAQIGEATRASTSRGTRRTAADEGARRLQEERTFPRGRIPEPLPFLELQGHVLLYPSRRASGREKA